MKRERLVDLFSRFREVKITVIGDLFLDRWYEIDEQLNSTSLETGRTVYHVVRKRSAAGGAGTVLNNLSAMGAGSVRAVSMAGEDGDGWELVERLKERGVNVDGIIRSSDIVTPSYIKPLFPVENYRFDIENLSHTPSHLEDEMIRKVSEAFTEAGVLVVLDQVATPNTGVLTDLVRGFLCDTAARYPDKLVVADSRVSIDKYRNIVVKCNNFEAAGIMGGAETEGPLDEDGVFENLERMSSRTGRPVIITCNKYGIAVEENGARHLLPAAKHDCPIDICGAGDACTAGMVSALAAGASYSEAAFIGNLASGVTVRQIGRTGTATQEAMLALYDEQFG